VTKFHIGFLGFENFNALDLVGPAETFACARVKDHLGATLPGYEISLIGLHRRRFQAESGLSFHPDYTLETAPAFDTIIVPGGAGLREAGPNRAVARWLASRAPVTRRIASVCTGIYGLAASGLLDGREATTHWRFAADSTARFPNVKIKANAIFLKDGCFYTSAGVTAGIDLALALVEEDYGREVALSVARELVVYLKRDGGQSQYSEPLRFQSQATDRLTELGVWISTHLDFNLTVEALAARVHLSPRQFIRRFKSAFGQTPAAFVQALRLDEARRRLSANECSFDRVADSVGFKNGDVFRKAFAQRFRISPHKYQQCFGDHPRSLVPSPSKTNLSR
jgi:transcriptional regulator GlxA family with amidase domain